MQEALSTYQLSQASGGPITPGDLVLVSTNLVTSFSQPDKQFEATAETLECMNASYTVGRRSA